jgi:hypothetical protein
MAVSFDGATRSVTGEPSIVADDAAMDSFFFQVHAASSETGLLVYATGGDLAIGRLAWVSRRDGDRGVEYLPDEPRLFGHLNLSPDGRRIAVHVGDARDNIWITEGGRGYRMQSSAPIGWPLWGPDSRRLVVRIPGSREDPGGYLLQDPENPALGDVVTRLAHPVGGPISWSPVGDVLALNLFEGSWHTYLARVGESPSTAAFAGMFAAFSPDSRYVAYASTEGTSTNTIYVRSYPEGRG